MHYTHTASLGVTGKKLQPLRNGNRNRNRGRYLAIREEKHRQEREREREKEKEKEKIMPRGSFFPFYFYRKKDRKRSSPDHKLREASNDAPAPPRKEKNGRRITQRALGKVWCCSHLHFLVQMNQMVMVGRLVRTLCQMNIMIRHIQRMQVARDARRGPSHRQSYNGEYSWRFACRNHSGDCVACDSRQISSLIIYHRAPFLSKMATCGLKSGYDVQSNKATPS